MRAKLIAGLAAVLALPVGMSVVPAFADYPERPITFINPWPPGDIEDQLVRVIAEEMQRETGVPTRVVNRDGGGAVEGATAVAQSEPDGYTIGNFVIDVTTMHVIRGNATYTRETFEPIGIFMTYPFALVTLKNKPYQTIEELAEYAKTNSVKLAHFGYDLIPSMATFVLAKELGFEFDADAAYEMVSCEHLLNGDVDVMNTTMPLVLPCLDDITVLTSFTEEPMSIAPDAPLLSSIVEGLDLSLWNGLFVPAGTPQEIKDKIAAVAERAIRTEKARNIVAPTGAPLYWMNAEEAAARIDHDYALAEDIIRRLEE